MPKSEEEAREEEQPETPPLSRRQFLRGAGAVGAATALAPGLMERGDAATDAARDDSRSPSSAGRSG